MVGGIQRACHPVLPVQRPGVAAGDRVAVGVEEMHGMLRVVEIGRRVGEVARGHRPQKHKPGAADEVARVRVEDRAVILEKLVEARRLAVEGSRVVERQRVPDMVDSA